LLRKEKTRNVIRLLRDGLRDLDLHDLPTLTRRSKPWVKRTSS
jgi:hypothetical protein